MDDHVAYDAGDHTSKIMKSINALSLAVDVNDWLARFLGAVTSWVGTIHRDSRPHAIR